MIFLQPLVSGMCHRPLRVCSYFWSFNVLRIILKLWLAVALAWIAYNAYVYREKLAVPRDWKLGLEYGTNNIFCDVKFLGNCRDLNTSIFQRSELNETFGMIVIFIGVPLATLFGLFILVWIFRKPRGA
jgi:hypothetical protein